MVHAKIKKEMLDEYLKLLKTLTNKTTKKGCRFYSFNQNKDDPTDFVLYEQWQSEEDLNNHIKELFEILGPARPGEPIPAKLMDMYEKAVPVFYDVVS
ncbi:MAG: antibiotic biosynthesis monooxygenase [Candidatus Heimdallarchaeota archaeon]|nr:antibiotic biosynthesis monooxygenase [Candidatus Heimdallarchaeota archaeon]